MAKTDKTDQKQERSYGEQTVRERDDDAGVLVVNGLLELSRLGRLTDDTYDRLKALVTPSDDDEDDDQADDKTDDDERQTDDTKPSDTAKTDATKATASRKATSR